MGVQTDVIAPAQPKHGRAKRLRLGFTAVALGFWTAWILWSLIRIEFIEILNPLTGWAVVALPVPIYALVMRKALTSVLVGLELIGTRVWIIWVLETSTSSTASLVAIPALSLDILTLGIAVIAEQLLLLFRGRK